MEFIHAFALYVFVGVNEDRRKIREVLRFRDINECVYYAQKLHKQGGQITAYCLPEAVDKNSKVY